MRSIFLVGMLLAGALVPRADFASAQQAFIPPIIEASVTGITSQALGDGRYQVSIEASLVNSSDAPLEGVTLRVVDAGGMPVDPSAEPVSVGTMAIAEPVVVTLDVETFRAPDPANDPLPLMAGSATDTFGEPLAVWVNVKEAAQ